MVKDKSATFWSGFMRYALMILNQTGTRSADALIERGQKS
jgi:hypothetical protein